MRAYQKSVEVSLQHVQESASSGPALDYLIQASYDSVIHSSALTTDELLRLNTLDSLAKGLYTHAIAREWTKEMVEPWKRHD